MPEKGPSPGEQWNLAKDRLRSIAMRMEYATENKIQGVRFLLSTSGQERQQAFSRSAAFTGETLNFFSDNLTARLAPLHPTKEQIQMFQFLMESVDDKTLNLEDKRGRIEANGEPYLVNFYRAGQPLGLRTGLTDLMLGKPDLFDDRYVSFTTRYGIHEPFAHSFSVYGSKGLHSTPGLDFITLPERATDSESLSKILV